MKHVCGLHIKEQCDLVRVCILYIVNITIMRLYYLEHKHSVVVVDSCGRCQDIEVHDDSTDKCGGNASTENI